MTEGFGGQSEEYKMGFVIARLKALDETTKRIEKTIGSHLIEEIAFQAEMREKIDSLRMWRAGLYGISAAVSAVVAAVAFAASVIFGGK